MYSVLKTLYTNSTWASFWAAAGNNSRCRGADSLGGEFDHLPAGVGAHGQQRLHRELLLPEHEEALLTCAGSPGQRSGGAGRGAQPKPAQGTSRTDAASQTIDRIYYGYFKQQ